MNINPFLQLNMIKDINLFYGREKTLQELAEHIHAGQSCSIIGEHKIGKSSILYLIGHDPKWRHILLDHAVFKFVYYDFQSDPEADKNSFWKNVLEELGDQIVDSRILQEIQSLRSNAEISASSIKSLFRKIRNAGLKLVLLLDEFDLISQNKDSFGFFFLSSLRSLMNQDFVVITASRRSLKEFIHWDGNTSPIYNLLREMYLGQLNLVDTEKLILQSKRPSKPSLRSEKDFILNQVGKHPYVVQRLCYHIYNQKRDNKKLSDSDLQNAVRQTYDDIVPFFENIWSGLSYQSKKILVLLTDYEVHLESDFDPDETRMLVKMGLVDVENGQLKLFSNIYRQFVRKQQVILGLSEEQMNDDLKSAQGLLNRKLRFRAFDVFLCHNSLDKPAVKRIGTELKQLGILPWLDEWNLRPGFPWQTELENTIDQISSAAVFIGKEGIGPWQQDELLAFLRQFHKRSCPVIPVLLPSCPKVPKLPIFLEAMGWVDFRKTDPNPFLQLLWGITGKKSDELEPWLSRLLGKLPIQDLIKDLEMY